MQTQNDLKINNYAQKSRSSFQDDYKILQNQLKFVKKCCMQTQNDLKIKNYAKIIPHNPLTHSPMIKNFSKKPKKSDYQSKMGGRGKYPPLVNSTFKFTQTIPVINDHPQLVSHVFDTFLSFSYKTPFSFIFGFTIRHLNCH